MTVATDASIVSEINAAWTLRDYFGTIRVRSNIGRMKYTVAPGLYALNHPDADSPVFISANYKLSFNVLRRALGSIDGWILVLDTKGINVWCAAGKGTFSSDELIRQIKTVQLDQVVNHRSVIVPQLGAPGVAAHVVKQQTGFKVAFGPIRAADIPEYIKRGHKATNEMRKVTFPLVDRLILAPVEMTQSFKYALLVAVVFFLLSGLQDGSFSTANMLNFGWMSTTSIFLGYLSGTLFTPMFLPHLPGRSFSLKGFWMGFFMFFSILLCSRTFLDIAFLERFSYLLIITAISSFFGMNFTGASTYTSLSGVKKEMRYAVPLQIAGFAIGTIVWVIYRFL